MTKKNPFGLFILLVFAFLICHKIIISNIIDPDLWFHIMTGQRLFNNFSVFWSDFYFSPVTESYSNLRFTALGDIILYLINSHFGVIGLTVFRAVCVMSCCLFLLLISDRKITFFKVFLLLYLVVGIYGKFFVRNSMFALIFFPLVLYLLDNKRYILTAIILILWSLCHGSYVLGVCVVFIVICCNVDNYHNTLKILIPALVVAVVISYNNPLTKSQISTSTIKKILTAKSFNTTIFTPTQNSSTDFKDPFKLIGQRIYIKFAFALALLALCLVKPKIRYILPFISVGILGAGYLRFVPYLAVIGVYVLILAEREGDLWKFDDIIFLIPIVFVSYSVYLHPGKFLHPVSKPGIGLSQMKFTEANADYALEKYRYEDTFTCISNGGYLLYKWFPVKRVFIDTFWEPHGNLYETYNKYCRNPDLIPYNSALINFAYTDLIEKFTESEKWHPESIDAGSVLFSTTPGTPFLNITQKELDEMTNYHKKVFLKVAILCGIPLS